MTEIKKSDFFEAGKEGVRKILTPADCRRTRFALSKNRVLRQSEMLMYCISIFLIVPLIFRRE